MSLLRKNDNRIRIDAMKNIVVGIDVGGSTTKIVGFTADSMKMISPMYVKAGDPVASVYGAFGKFTSENGIAIADIERVMITGVGSSFIGGEIYGIPTDHVTEFTCIGLGGLYLSGLCEAVVVSMGTGTAMVHARTDGGISKGAEAAKTVKTDYLGGTGVGGGTIIGMSKKMLGVSDVTHLVELANGGDLGNIDLTVADITSKDILPGLPLTTTAANFGKLSDVAHKADVALGILNMVFESIGMLGVFAAKRVGTNDVVLTGNLTTIPQSVEVFTKLSEMYGMNMLFPENARYATVVGTALAFFAR